MFFTAFISGLRSMLYQALPYSGFSFVKENTILITNFPESGVRVGDIKRVQFRRILDSAVVYSWTISEVCDTDIA